jgi:hypothetical protein
MSGISFRSPGVSARVINLSTPSAVVPLGVPAGVIATSPKGPAFVPTTVASSQEFFATFGTPSDNSFHGPLAVSEWLRNQQSATFLRVLGTGMGKRREVSGVNAGRVDTAGFIVGAQQPQEGGALGTNGHAVFGGPLGRTYFLTTLMSESNQSGVLTGASLRGYGVPMVRGVILVASGVVPTLSSAINVVSTPPDGVTAAGVADVGSVTGSVNLNGGRQEFVLLLNGHKGAEALYPNVITASFDVDAPNYLSRQLNTDPLNLEKAGYVLYADYSIHPNLAVVTGSRAIVEGGGTAPLGYENVVFILSGAQGRNSGSTVGPNYEGFEDRFRTAHSTWIISQKFGGKPVNLFRIHHLSDGASSGTEIKWSIENISPSISDLNPYGTFDLLVRSLTDTDKRRVVLEAHRGLTLNPESDSYIGRVIGDQHTFYNFDAAIGSQKLVTTGDFETRSRYVRVEIADVVKNQESDAKALPMGFRGPAHLVTSGSAPLAGMSEFADAGYYTLAADIGNLGGHVVQMPVPYRENITLGPASARTVDKGLYWGVQTERKISADEPNASVEREQSLLGFINYFPNYHTDFLNAAVEGNEGAADSPETGILDADRFNNNLFSLENVKIRYNTATDLPDTTLLVNWSYQRAGGVATDVGAGTRALKVADLSDPSTRQVAKFTGILHGGFDGVRVFDADTAHLTNLAVVEEMNNTSRGTADGATVVAYKKALELMSDGTDVDIQLLAIPGIRHPVVTDEALLAVTNRFDALYLMDPEEYDTSNLLMTGSSQVLSVRFTATNHRDRGLNNSFGATYFPDVIVRDDVSRTVRQVPPSVPVLGAIGLNDTIGFEWFAPAGFSRGALESAEETVIPLNRDNLDALSEVKINGIVAFAGSEGPVVWGQRTLLAQDSVLESISTRRLLLHIRRQVRGVANKILFEPNRESTLANFSALVNPILKRVQDNRGLKRFLVRIDTSTTTEADIQNRTVRGKIFLIPTRTLEFLDISFVVSNRGTVIT